MTGNTLVWLRWLQFVDLGVVFGAPLTACLLGERHAGANWRRALALGCFLGLLFGAASFAFTLARMAGSGIDYLDRSLIVMMLTGSALGWSMIARGIVLTVAMVLALTPLGGSGKWLSALAGLGAIAVASLAWAGHAAASQGAVGFVRLGGDVAHLWAGLTWLGALMLFITHLWQARADDHAALTRLTRELGAFSGLGTVLVGVLVASGFGNLLFLSLPGQWLVIAQTAYGRMLITKLALFAVMFLLAANNRFRLVPALETTDGHLARQRALGALRRSITLEGLLALGVIWCIAYAGTLDPMGAA